MDECREGARKLLKQARENDSTDIYTQVVTTCNIELEKLWSDISGHEDGGDVSVSSLMSRKERG